MTPDNTAPFEFQAGTNVLRGFIDLPGGPGKHPAVVIVRGRRKINVTEDPYFDEMRRAFREAGIATVIWDMAGSESWGEYPPDSPRQERATETVAAIQALKRREDIDESRIGLWALGQGGIVAPMVAIRSSEVAFLIVVNGSTCDPIDEAFYASLHILADQGVPEHEAREVCSALLRSGAMLRAGASDEEMIAALAILRNYPDLEWIYPMDVPSIRSQRRRLRDPEWSIGVNHFLRYLTQPTLVIFGERDGALEWRTGIEMYRDAFAKSGNSDLTIKTFANADFMMRPTATEAQPNSIFVNSYIATMMSWLRTRGFAPNYRSDG